MATWSDLDKHAPDIAAAGRRLLPEVAFVATVNAHGRPRVHPFCPVIAEGRLWGFVMHDSPKRRDLDANGYFAIHAMLGPEDEEFYAAGTARRESGRALREIIATAMPYDDADERHLLYEFSLDSAMWTTWEHFQEPGMRPIHRTWRAS